MLLSSCQLFFMGIVDCEPLLYDWKELPAVVMPQVHSPLPTVIDKANMHWTMTCSCAPQARTTKFTGLHDTDQAEYSQLTSIATYITGYNMSCNLGKP